MNNMNMKVEEFVTKLDSQLSALLLEAKEELDKLDVPSNISLEEQAIRVPTLIGKFEAIKDVKSLLLDFKVNSYLDSNDINTSIDLKKFKYDFIVNIMSFSNIVSEKSQMSEATNELLKYESYIKTMFSILEFFEH